MKKLFSLLALLLFTSTVFAQAFPSRPITILIPAAAGGPADQIIRALAKPMSEEFKQPIIVENKPGASGIIAAEYLARSKPDGYTLLLTTEAIVSMLPHMYKELPYNATTAFSPVTQLVDVPMVLVVRKSLPVATLKEYIDYASARPGAVSYGSDGQGGVAHLPMVVLEKNNRIKLNHIPYKGSAPIIPDMLGENVDSTLVAVALVQQYLKTGQLRALAISSPSRLPTLANVPTFDESGIKDIGGHFIMGLVAPAGTPAEATNKIAASARRILNTPEFKSRYIDPFAYRVITSTPKEFEKYIKADYENQRERIDLAGLSKVY